MLMNILQLYITYFTEMSITLKRNVILKINIYNVNVRFNENMESIFYRKGDSDDIWYYSNYIFALYLFI